MPSSLTNANGEHSIVELFIPVPEELSRENSFRRHIATRNFFAFLLGKPLVGDHMGQAFVDVQERLHHFRPSHPNNHQDFLDYAENQGYRDLVECTDYALASLYYAEHFKLRDIWVDAFAHCVGMSDSLVLSPEYVLTSKLTKALITRAHLEVDGHLGRVSTALSRFLQEDLSPTHLGLTDGARSHLDRFRRFLHTFYVDKFGYWPPPRGAAFPKALYKSMYYDFQNLYDYLVDTDSTADISSQRPASGGICVLQNIATFDQRHGFKSQPHPLPLLPTYTSPLKRTNSQKTNSQKALRQLVLASQYNKSHVQDTMHGALAAATNVLEPSAMESNIVQAYIHFEKAHATSPSQRQGKVSATDARKVRWLLIYGTLQYLVSALRAPKEVRDTESPEYALCYVAEPTSTTNSVATTPLASPPVKAPVAIDEGLDESQSSLYSIEPDCQREDYFTPQNMSRRGSMESPKAEFEFGFEKDKSEVTHDVHELSQVDSTIGMAVSTPPSPTRPRMNLFPDTRPTFTAEEARALIADKRPNLPYRNRSKSTSSVLDNTTSPAKDSRFSTPVSTTPTGYWEQYKATLTQQKARSNPGSPTGTTSPSMAKIPTAFKAPFSRLRPRNEEDRGVKTERRLSTLWRH
ncbi:uncharacterized protein J4E92_005100 [Alternaria infectoria]|uniref:uncharacterized protein n=1 Tax=Alternaria infectoria TaxID=45303 RepID=UPI00221FE093|nr:uncharacterized protein J4E92_005100 [Alternaria infectoria]KAI4929436.1 hypothetical protein J4E92_005100 [Alternaria infectoria]